MSRCSNCVQEDSLQRAVAYIHFMHEFNSLVCKPVYPSNLCSVPRHTPCNFLQA